MATTYDHNFKFTIIGDSGVGKSCLMMRFADNTFDDSFITTIGVDFRFRTLKVEDKTVKLQIWDTAGQEKFKTITASYYRNAHAVMIVYDVSDQATFQHLESWLDDVQRYCPDDICKMIIGNKSDMDVTERQVTYETAETYANELGIPYIETSAKTANQVEAAFTQIVKELIKKKSAPKNNPVPILPPNQQQQGGCCNII